MTASGVPLANPQPAAVRFRQRLRNLEDAQYVYTYPFKGSYRSLEDANVAVRSLGGHLGRLNAYVHVPYCNMKCSFCNLLTTTSHDATGLSRYASMVSREIRLWAAHLDPSRYEIDSLYIGGGTPTVLPDGILGDLVGILRESFHFHPAAALSIEASPDSVDTARLTRLASIGFHRISLGIQSLDEEELRHMGRTYGSALARRALRAAVEAPFSNVNVDLVCGLPGQTPAAFLRSVSAIVEFGVPSVTIYPLVFRTRTRFGRAHELAPHAFPRGEARHASYEAAVALLVSRGYRQETMVAFTKVESASRHEANEFNGLPTLGLGAGALSYAPSVHFSSGRYYAAESTAQTLAAYASSVEAGCLPIRSGIELDEDERARRYVILGLSYAGVDRAEFMRAFGTLPECRYSEEFRVLLESACLDEVGERLVLSRRGRAFTNLVADLFSSDTVRELARVYR